MKINLNQANNQTKTEVVGKMKKVKRNMKAALGFCSISALSLLSGTAMAAGFDLANLKVSENGVYRVDIQALAEQGIDLRGVDLSRLGMRSKGKVVPLDIVDDGNGLADFGDEIRFIGEGVDTLYTNQSVYVLLLDGLQQPMGVVSTAIPAGAAAPSYIETRRYAPQSVYSMTSPTDDPWYALRLLSYDAPAEAELELLMDNYDTAAGAPVLSVSLWGDSDLEGKDNDHHVEVFLNSSKVADASFDGISAYSINEQLNTGLSGGPVKLRVNVPGDTGHLFDIVNVDEVKLSYPRRFVADGKGLTFKSHWPKYRIDGFVSEEISVYVENEAGETLKIENALTGGTCNVDAPACGVMFGGVSGSAVYYAVAEGGYMAPEIGLPVVVTDIDTAAGIVVIAHPGFIGLEGQPLEAYVAQLSAEIPAGALLVDVEQIYAQYAYGEFGPTAIKDYIKAAYARGTSSVVLVGGDVYDYHDYKDNSAVSFIPSMYVATNPVVSFTPSDPKYVDVNDDNVPDLSIARLPVRTAFELVSMLNKRNAYMNNQYGQKAVFAADKTSELDQYDFAADLDSLIDQYFDGWRVNKVYLDEMSPELANQQLSTSINNGVALTVYSGHSSSDQLSFYGLFDGEDAAGLNNAGSPTVVTQWGCWNTYNINPDAESMSQQLLLEGETGAAAVLGTSAVAKVGSEKLLADLFYAELETGVTLGSALTQAKKAYAANNGVDLDVLLGVTIMGFPGLSVQ